MEYDIKFILPDDYLFLGPDTVTPGVSYNIQKGTMTVLNLDIEMKSRIRECSTERIRSPCLQNHSDSKFGTNYSMIYQKYIYMQNLKIAGTHTFESITKCLEPCNEYLFPVYKLFHRKVQSMPHNDYGVIYALEKGFDLDRTSAVMIMHMKNKKTKQYRQRYQYDILQFVGDVGGTIGIFLGLSFWSIYQDVIDRFITYILIRNKNK